jgi:uncharacterized protein (DUF2141 family)
MRLFLSLITLFLITSSGKIESSYKLTVSVSGVISEEGDVHIALYREQDTFPVSGKQYKGQVIAAKSNVISGTFTNLKAGTYAIAVFHDLNKNGKLDKNLFGAPTERYGFSNNARSTFSAPSFSAAAFELKKDNQLKISIR